VKEVGSGIEERTRRRGGLSSMGVCAGVGNAGLTGNFRQGGTEKKEGEATVKVLQKEGCVQKTTKGGRKAIKAETN